MELDSWLPLRSRYLTDHINHRWEHGVIRCLQDETLPAIKNLAPMPHHRDATGPVDTHCREIHHIALA
jgi:hypothetical protein